MSKPDKLSEQEKALFASWVKDVRPLKKGREKVLHQTRPTKQARQHAVFDEDLFNTQWSDPQYDEQMLSASDHTEQRGGGIQKQLFKKLRQGKIPIEARLDLHGNSVNLARSRINQFIQLSQNNGLRCICIVHGKGTHNEHGKAILKSMVNHWLQQTPQVLAFTSAMPKDGGTGAIYVLLKRLKD